jgi:hypothetical protein
MLTRARDVGDGLEDAIGEMSPLSRSNTTSEAWKLVATVAGRIISELRAGAQSSRNTTNTTNLTYADGWAAAATLAGLVSAETVSDLMSGAIE